ncbi:hypothetical protein ONZ45_g8330 [Pleurotus djamor]|nr:hypothetical protein ONZ45_g8330 [Pleurotus djamor]
MAGYNRTREVEELLQRTESKPPSFTVHLHPEYWSLNHGSKFLYNNHIASLLDDIRAHRIPVDFLEMFDTARVPFYDGCMIVELLDYRPQKQKDTSLDKPDRTRVVLHPDSETLWADICLLNKKHGQTWTDMDALEAEARILLATSPPLCLDPNPHLTRIANHILRVSTPAVPNSLKRKAAELEREEDEVEKTRRHKLMSFMSPRSNPPQTQTQPSQYRLLETIQRLKQAKEMASSQPAPPPSQPNIPLPNLVVNTTIPTQSVSLPASARMNAPQIRHIHVQV